MSAKRSTYRRVPRRNIWPLLLAALGIGIWVGKSVIALMQNVSVINGADLTGALLIAASVLLWAATPNERQEND